MFRAWVKKHRRAILVAAGVVGAGCCAYYALSQRPGRNALPEYDFQSALLRKEAEDRAEAQLQSHFESIQKISDTTTLPSILPHLRARLFALVDLTGLMDKLLHAKEHPMALSAKEKVQLWQELKIRSFTRSVSAFWAVSLLDLFIRTQLNILGRHVYTDTARGLEASKCGDIYTPLSIGCQHKFIAFADYLPYKGLSSLVADVQEVVETVMKNKALKDEYDVEGLHHLFAEIRKSFEDTTVSWTEYMLPVDDNLPADLAAASLAADAAQPTEEPIKATDDDARLSQLMKETRRVLSSVEFRRVLSAAVDAMLERVTTELSANYEDHCLPLAKLLPAVASVGNSLLEDPEDNKYTQLLSRLPSVESFCAIVYSNTAED